MKARLILILLFCAAVVHAFGQTRPAIPGMTALCLNPSNVWIPMYVAGGGQSVPYGGMRVPLYGQNNGTSYPVPCDANGNLFPGGAAGGDLSGTYPNPVVDQVNGAALPASKTIVGTNPSGQLIDATGATVGGDLSGSLLAPSVVKVNGAAVPTSKALLGANGSGQLIDATGTAPGGDLSGTWGTPGVAKVNGNTYPANAGFTSGGIPYFSSTTAMGSSALLTNHGLLVGGGAGAAPAALAVGGANFPLIGVAAANPAWSTIAWLASATQWGLVYMSSATQMATTAALTANALIKAGSAAAPSASSVVDNGTYVTSTEIFKTGNTQLLTANSSGITATTPGTVEFTWGALPASKNLSLHCAGLYSQATAAGGVGIAIQGATNAPTRIDAWAELHTTNAGASVQGNLANLTTTTATSIISGTPGAITTIYQYTIDGTVQVAASATTLNVLFYTGNASDAVTIYAGSYCTLMP